MILALLRKNLLVLLCFILLLSPSCRDDDDDTVENNLTIDFSASFGEEVLSFQNEYAVGEERIKFSTLIFYVSNITLLSADGSEEIIPDAFLINIADPSTISLNVPGGNYTGIKFGIGLDEETNAQDPSTYETGHPLSDSQNMYWSMVKYKFFVVEGRMDEQPIGTELFNTAFAYHLGFDELYNEATVTKEISTSESAETSIDLNLDLEKVFFTGPKPIDVLNNLSSHTTLLPVSYNLAENISQAFE